VAAPRSVGSTPAPLREPKTKKAVKRSAVPSVVPVAFVGNMVTLGVINLDEPAKPARQA